ncbi:MAG: phosphosulfolactate synthase [Bacteroidota bacterium]
MNFKLPYMPERAEKPRNNGLTMMMDKGLSIRETEDLVSASADFIDLAKMGFGTSMITNNLEKKIQIYKEANIKPYFGGTLFEAFAARNLLKDYIKYNEKYKMEYVEVSDGCMKMNTDEKLEFIHKLSKHFTVLSEVGSKEAGIMISPARWIKMMQEELKAGSWKVIAEARESGNVGIYRPNGNAHVSLVNKILNKINQDDIIWETPHKPQAVWFIKLLGANVNLGNIGSNEVIPTETLRLGLRGDTFLTFMPEEMQLKLKQQ